MQPLLFRMRDRNQETLCSIRFSTIISSSWAPFWKWYSTLVKTCWVLWEYTVSAGLRAKASPPFLCIFFHSNGCISEKVNLQLFRYKEKPQLTCKCCELSAMLSSRLRTSSSNWAFFFFSNCWLCLRLATFLFWSFICLRKVRRVKSNSITGRSYVITTWVLRIEYIDMDLGKGGTSNYSTHSTTSMC